MGRPRIVELDDAVTAAMACFREHGYEATSIRRLEHATGLKATSLYNAFGSKAGLFETVLVRYEASVVDRRIVDHLRPEVGLAGIREFFVSTYMREPHPEHGCLLTNSAVEFSSLSPAARVRVQQGLQRIRRAFAAQLRTAQHDGEIAATVDVDNAADTLLVLYQGVLALLRTGLTVDVNLDALVDTALNQLRPQ